MKNNSIKPTTIFWAIAIIALLWNAMGIMAFFQQVGNSETFRAQYSAEQLLIIDNLPSWYIIIFGVAVFASLLGCILLLLRSKWAKTVFLIALIAVIIQTFYNLFLYEGKEYYKSFEYIMLIMIPVFSLFLYWYSFQVEKKGWIS